MLLAWRKIRSISIESIAMLLIRWFMQGSMGSTGEAKEEPFLASPAFPTFVFLHGKPLAPGTIRPKSKRPEPEKRFT